MKARKVIAALAAWTMVFAGTAGLLPEMGIGIPEIGSVLTAKAGEYNGLEYTVWNDGIEITGCDTTLTSVKIPAEIDGNPVTCIGESAFSGCTRLTSITVPDGVTSIRENAFYGCTALTSITIPNSLRMIEGYAFSGCAKLASVTIPNNVRVIGMGAFYGCAGLTSITIPNSVTSFGGYAFYNCTGLKNVIISDGATKIAEYAFSGCTGLTNITIPDSVTDVGEYAFNGTAWYNAQPNGVVYLRNCLYAYKGEMPNNTTVAVRKGTICIANNAFVGRTGLTSITIPNSVKGIGAYAFQGCTGLTSITIPDSVTSIGVAAFNSCTGLKSITIPDSVMSIGEIAFQGCTRLTDVTIFSPDCEIREWWYERDTFPAAAAIHGYANSTAQTYATEHGNPFVSLGEAPAKVVLGDLDGDNAADASDASLILIASAQAGAAGSTGLTPEREKAADVNGDGQPDATDASIVLMYAAACGTGYDGTLEDYVKKM